MTARSMLTFAPVVTGELPDCDWVFVYSRTGAHYAANSLAGLSPRTRIAAMGPGTAEALRAVGHEPEFIGAGEARAIAEDFAAVAGRGARVVFVQAANSRRSIQRALGDRIDSTAHVVYRSGIDPEREVPAADVYLLTSPLNAEAVLSSPSATPTAELRVLGDTTATWCREHGYAPRRWTPPAAG